MRGSAVPLPSNELIISILTRFDLVCVPKYKISCNTVWNYVSYESGMSQVRCKETNKCTKDKQNHTQFSFVLYSPVLDCQI